MNQSEDEYGFVGKNFRNKKLVVVLVFAVVVTSKAHYYQLITPQYVMCITVQKNFIRHVPKSHFTCGYV